MNMETALSKLAKSPNASPNNTIVRCDIGEFVYLGWNLKPKDPHEKDVKIKK